MREIWKLTWVEIFEPKPNFIPQHVFYCLPDIPWYLILNSRIHNGFQEALLI